MKQLIKSIPGIRFLYISLANSVIDLGWRGWGVLMQTIDWGFPDLLIFNPFRVISLTLAGMKIDDRATFIVRKNVFFEYPHNVHIGKNVQINRGSYIGSNGKVTIGDGVRMGMNVHVLTISHKGINYEIDDVQPVTIGKGAHLGAGSIILPGTVIDEGVLVAPGAVVTGTTKPYGIYVGNPARLSGFREEKPN